jgi:hypothetical protein
MARLPLAILPGVCGGFTDYRSGDRYFGANLWMPGPDGVPDWTDSSDTTDPGRR